jgi:hypothetical protein
VDTAKSKLTRRQILKGGLASAVACSAPMVLSSRVLRRAGNTGPNSHINFGIVSNGLTPTKAATDDGQRKMLNSVCSKIATRLNTDEARALVQGLK